MKKSAVFIWTIILVDLLSGLLLTLQIPFARVGLVIKGGVILFLFIYYLINIRQKTFLSIYLAMAILFLFWSVGFSISLLQTSDFDFGESFIVLNRYLFFLILTCAFVDWSEYDHFESTSKKILETFFLFNNAFIFIGFIFKVKMLSTYDPLGEYGDDWRFGYKGLIWGQNAVAAIYTLGIAYYFRETFRHHQNKILGLVTTCLAAILLGTKATWLTLILIGGFYLYKYRIKILIVLIIPALVGLVYLIIAKWEFLKEKYLSFMIMKFEEMEFLTFLTSGRNDYLSSTIDHIRNQWTFVNYITGDAISYIEMDMFDMYFYFGIASILYFYIYTKVFFIKDRSWDSMYFYFVWMAMAFTAGHIINSAVVPIFFLLFAFSARPEKSKIVLSKSLTLKDEL